jgi:signal transduction histidine kinase
VLTLFTIRFLNVRQYSKTMYYVLLSLMGLGVIAFILVATGTLYSAGNNLLSSCTVAFMTSGVVCRVKGNKAANYFIAAWTIYFTGGLLLTLRNSGVLDYNFWTTYFVQIGAALETIIIAFALGDQYRRLRIEKEEAQAFALKLQHEATVELGRKVSERTEQLSKANEELQGALETNRQQTKIIENKNAELDAFFYRISHDLKGPISSLQGLSWLAQMEVKDPLARSYVEKQHQQIDRLNNIVTGLINLIMLSHTELNKEKIDPKRLVDECIASLNGQPNFKNITFKKEIQEGMEFYSEWTLLNTILQNLVENAIKYARNDSPFVKIEIFQNEKDVMLVVEDNGHGIPKEHQSKIFEMFYRASHNVNGTGLGLYILKRSLDKLNGTIDIKSEVGVGSTFTVVLPLEN